MLFNKRRAAINDSPVDCLVSISFVTKENQAGTGVSLLLLAIYAYIVYFVIKLLQQKVFSLL